MDETESADQYLERAYDLEEQGQFGMALAECDAAIATAQSFLANAYNLRGIILEELGQKERAMRAYEQALVAQPGFREAADNLYELEQEIRGEFNLVTIATSVQPAEAHVLRARLETEGIWSFVADESTASWLPTNTVGWVKLQVKAQDVEKAVRVLGLELPEDEWTKAAPEIDVETERADYLQFLGDEYVDQEQWDQAIHSYLAALEIDPLNGDLYNSLGVAYDEAGRYDEAEAAYKRAVELLPDESMSYYNLGTMYEALGRVDQAIEAYTLCRQRSNDLQEQGEIDERLATLQSQRGT